MRRFLTQRPDVTLLLRSGAAFFGACQSSSGPFAKPSWAAFGESAQRSCPALRFVDSGSYAGATVEVRSKGGGNRPTARFLWL